MEFNNEESSSQLMQRNSQNRSSFQEMMHLMVMPVSDDLAFQVANQVEFYF